MKQIIAYFSVNVKKHCVLVYAFCIVFLASIIIGVFLGLPSSINDIYCDYVLQFFNNVLAKDSSLLKFTARRFFNVVLLYVPVVLLSLNDVSFYGIFLIVFYKGYVLGIALKTVYLYLNIFGTLIFVFTLFIETVLVIVSIILFASVCYKQNDKKSPCFFDKLIKKTLLCLAIASVGIEIEVFLLICIFRPINFYF